MGSQSVLWKPSNPPLPGITETPIWILREYATSMLIPPHGTAHRESHTHQKPFLPALGLPSPVCQNLWTRDPWAPCITVGEGGCEELRYRGGWWYELNCVSPKILLES